MLNTAKIILSIGAISLFLALINISIKPSSVQVAVLSSQETVQTKEMTETVDPTPEIKESIVNEKDILETPKKQSTVSESRIQASPSPIPELPPIDFEKINDNTKAALVNILCTSDGGGIQPISGSGVIISKEGVILTNAHIGQYFLLNEYVDCLIRTGSPAVPKYKAKLLYISEKWIADNAENITATNPQGTGENDFSFLLITEGISAEKLPDSLPFLNFDETYMVPKQENALAAGYPAGFFGGFIIFNNLHSMSSIVTVGEVFTFLENTVDLFSIGASLIAQKGSSGGAVVNGEGNLVGIIVTATDAESTAERDMRAISLFHINNSFNTQIGVNIKDVLNNLLFYIPSLENRNSISQKTLIKAIED